MVGLVAEGGHRTVGVAPPKHRCAAHAKQWSKRRI